jgi:hypothetical protein
VIDGVEENWGRKVFIGSLVFNFGALLAAPPKYSLFAFVALLVKAAYLSLSLLASLLKIK